MGRANNPGGKWSVEPGDAGTNLPPVGRSLFDFLVTQEQGNRRIYNIPFPFEALVDHIENQLEARDRRAVVKSVLIPLGRSLQRDAAAPNFFHFPRVVIAVDGTPRVKPGESGMLLKDRLYLGYHEKAEAVEVISYNESAGRFEFQVVKDYRPGGTPEVSYAHRALCVSCHQNHAPIFSRPVWAETNANVSIAARLQTQRHAFYELPAHQPIDVPSAIDNATDRANEFVLTQLLWRDGCEFAGGAKAGIQCRAGAFTALLQYLLSGSRFFDNKTQTYRLLPVVATHWARKWPGGLWVPDPDLPNRNPLHEISASSEYLTAGNKPGAADAGAPGQPARWADVGAIFDPLAPRPPLETWRPAQSPERAIARLIEGLSHFMAPQDIARLDQHLFATAVQAKGNRLRFDASCSFLRNRRGASAAVFKFRCGEARTVPGGRGHLFMEGRFYRSAGKSFEGAIARIQLGGAEELSGVAIVGGGYEGDRGNVVLRLSVAQEGSGLHPRLADGNAVAAVRLSAPELGAALPSASRKEFTGAGEVIVLQDFFSVRDAIRTMAHESDNGALDVFSARPFRRAVLLKELYERLGIRVKRWCCADDDGMPAPHVDEPQSQAKPADARQDAQPAIKLFYRYCAACHGLSSPTPPNFLYGELAQVKSALAHCAPRIHFRLEMWRLEPRQRPKSPMPPIHDFQQLHLAQQNNLPAGDIAILKTYAVELLKNENPAAGHGGVDRRYADLRRCLPEKHPRPVYKGVRAPTSP
jgi:hypothetical protein